MNELEDNSVHSHTMAHYVRGYGGDDMTCQDCIHYKSIGTLCDKYIYPEERNNEPCDFFINNDGTYENGSWHCPRCGAEVPVWGLCNKCEDILASWESVSK